MLAKAILSYLVKRTFSSDIKRRYGEFIMAHDEKEYAGKGMAGSALGLGIAGTALALLNNNGGLGNLLGVNNPVGGAPQRFGYPGHYGPHGHMGFEIGYVIDNERRIGRLESKTEGIEVAVVKDKEIDDLKIQLAQANLIRYVDDKTCGMVKGQNLINPNQIGDPYMGQRMVIATHPPVVEFNRFGPGPYGPYPFGGNGCCEPKFDCDRWY